MRSPSLQLHKHTGQWFTHWGGRDHYFGKDKAMARDRYAASMEEWAEWRRYRDAQRPVSRGKVPTITDLVELFIRDRRTRKGWDAADYFHTCLKRLIAMYGNMPADWLRPKHLNDLQLDMIRHGFKPRTINHDIAAVKTMYRWSAMLDAFAPIDFGGVKQLPVGATHPVRLTVDAVRALVNGAPPNLRPWLAITYLAFLRPSETVRLVGGHGRWHETVQGVFILDKGKTDERAALKRHLILSPQAREQLAACKPLWSRLDSFSAACRRREILPSVLRDSAAAHIHQLHSATRDDTELLLGHYGGRMKVTYYLPSFERLVEIASRLTL